MIPKAQTPPRPREALLRPTPAGACDCHVHLFAAPGEFPMDPDRTEDPAPGDLAAWLTRLRRHLADLGLERGVIVHSVLYREDNSMTLAALAALGAERFRGVALLRPDVADSELDALHAAGMRGMRLNFSFPGALSFDDLERLAPRLAERGWHVLINIPPRVRESLAALGERLSRLPIDVVLDHYGYPDAKAGVEAPAVQVLLDLLRSGRVWIKLSAANRQCSPPYGELDAIVNAFVATKPDRLLWGSDWPHVRLSGPPPDDAKQLNALARQAPDPNLRRRILVDNPARLYGFPG